MSRQFQFSLRALLILMLAVACFFGGVRFERERRRIAEDRERHKYDDLIRLIQETVAPGTGECIDEDYADSETQE